jgi:hypothetical protein
MASGRRGWRLCDALPHALAAEDLGLWPDALPPSRRFVTMEIKSTSPDGRFQVTVEPWEARNSLWVESPTLRDTRRNEVLLRFESEMWSLASSEWQAAGCVQLTLRKYPGNHAPAQIVTAIDCIHRTAKVQSMEPVSLRDLEVLLERQLTWN